MGKSSGQGKVEAHPCPRASGRRGSRGPGRAPAPAFWAGEERRPGSRQFPPSAPKRGPSADWPAPGRKLGLYLQLITPAPHCPHPVGAEGPQAELAPPLPIGSDTSWEGGLRKTRLLLRLQATNRLVILFSRTCVYSFAPLANGEDGNNLHLRLKRTLDRNWFRHSFAVTTGKSLAPLWPEFP